MMMQARVLRASVTNATRWRAIERLAGFPSRALRAGVGWRDLLAAAVACRDLLSL
jgi:hypothetical protein